MQCLPCRVSSGFSRFFEFREFQLVRTDLGEVRRDHLGRDVLDTRRRPSRITILFDHGGAHALAEIVAGKHLQRRAIFRAPGIPPAILWRARAAAASASPPCRAAIFRTASSRSPAPVPSRRPARRRQCPACDRRRTICRWSPASRPQGRGLAGRQSRRSASSPRLTSRRLAPSSAHRARRGQLG